MDNGLSRGYRGVVAGVVLGAMCAVPTAAAAPGELLVTRQRVLESIAASNTLPLIDCNDPGRLIAECVAIVGDMQDQPVAVRLGVYRLLTTAVHGEMCAPENRRRVDREDVLSALIVGASDKEPAIRAHCAQYLSMVPPARYEMVRPVLVALMADQHAPVLMNACGGLAKIGVSAPADVALMESVAMWTHLGVRAAIESPEWISEQPGAPGTWVVEMRRLAVLSTRHDIKVSAWLDRAEVMNSEGRAAVAIALSYGREAEMLGPISPVELERIEALGERCLGDRELRPRIGHREVYRLLEAAVPRPWNIKDPSERIGRVALLLEDIAKDERIHGPAGSEYFNGLARGLRMQREKLLSPK